MQISKHLQANHLHTKYLNNWLDVKKSCKMLNPNIRLFQYKSQYFSRKQSYKISRKLLMAIINLFIVYMENARLSIYLSQFDTNLNLNFPHRLLCFKKIKATTTTASLISNLVVLNLYSQSTAFNPQSFILLS